MTHDRKAGLRARSTPRGWILETWWTVCTLFFAACAPTTVDAIVRRDAAVDASPSDAATPDAFATDGATDVWYRESFDEGVGFFTPTDQQTPAGYRDGRASEFGGVFDEWHTPDLGDGDRSLTLYKTANLATVRWRLTLPNDTGRTIEGVRLRYDLETAWVRFQSADENAPEYDTNAHHVSWYDGNTLLARSGDVVNLTVAESDRARWLTNDDQDRLGLRVVGVVHELPDVRVLPGQAWVVEWGFDPSDTRAERHMSVGIDELVVEALGP
ncbi:MAG: hypothetical protein H6721_31480 [Sandaracinus sp.]|nr:hypothetical protein [Sandaracinus sp.]